MAWSASIRKEHGGSSRLIAIIYTDDAGASPDIFDRFEIGDTITPDYLSERARVRIDQLTEQDALLAEIVEGPIELKPPPPPPPDPTPEEAAKTQFFELYFKFQSLKPLIDSGGIPGDDPGFVSLQADVKKLYKPEYFGVSVKP